MKEDWASFLRVGSREFGLGGGDGFSPMLFGAGWGEGETVATADGGGVELAGLLGTPQAVDIVGG